jgi:hypothetical protein
MRKVFALLVVLLGCGRAAGDGPWSSSSAELRLHTLTVYDSIGPTSPPPPSTACLRFPRAAMSPSQVQVLEEARVAVQIETCGADGYRCVVAEIVDGDGTSATLDVHGGGCKCMTTRSGLPWAVAEAFLYAPSMACP